MLADASGRAKPPTIVWYDKAFPTTENARIDRRHSMQVVLHEVAHAFDQHDASDMVAADPHIVARHGTQRCSTAHAGRCTGQDAVRVVH